MSNQKKKNRVHQVNIIQMHNDELQWTEIIF